jgi:hypothetical protein
MVAEITLGERQMQQDLLLRFSHAILRAAAAALIVLAGAQAASATGNKEAVALCEQELMSSHGAQEIRDVNVIRHDHAPFVYGNADFSDATGVHFRCSVYHEKVRAIRYLVKNPSMGSGRAWAKARPHGAEHRDLQLDDAAKMPPPQNPPDPHFQPVP